MVNLLNFTRSELINLMTSFNVKTFHGAQIFKWIHQYGISDFSKMTDLSKKLRECLTEQAEIVAPSLASEHISQDDTVKWMLRLHDGNCIETVFIPEIGRGTLCISSQVGCALNCSFCSTAQQGFNRNLDAAEIIGQLWFASRRLSKLFGRHDFTITNIVLMGMGEPLLNVDNVVKAMDIMMDDLGYGLSKYKVTLSTSGVIPGLLALREQSQCSLALSLHAPNNLLRDVLVPINRKYPLEELMPICKDYFKIRGENKRKVLMEYVMLEGVNDSMQHARELIDLLEDMPVKINLIPFNPFQGAPYKRTSMVQIKKFQELLLKANLNTRIRKTRGDDISAACGQLVGQVHDRTRRQKTFSKLSQIPVDVSFKVL